MKVKFKSLAFSNYEFQRSPSLIQSNRSDGQTENWVPLLWKTDPQSGIKPVIARDTTGSVSSLTCTTGRSNFAIPSNEISSHGNGVEVRRVKEHRQSSEPEVTRQLHGQIEAQAPGFLMCKSGAQTFHNHELQPSGAPKGSPEVRFESAVAVPRSSPGARR